MTRMLVAPQEVLRNHLKIYATGMAVFDPNSMAKIWIDGTESLSFLLSNENLSLLQQLQLGPPEAIPDVAHSAQIELFDLRRQLQLLANFRLLRFEGKGNTIIPVVDPGDIEVTILKMG